MRAWRIVSAIDKEDYPAWAMDDATSVNVLKIVLFKIGDKISKSDSPGIGGMAYKRNSCPRAIGARFARTGKPNAMTYGRIGKTTATWHEMTGKAGSTITIRNTAVGTGAMPRDTGDTGIICGTTTQ